MSFPGSIANRKRRAEEAALRNARITAAAVQAASGGSSNNDRNQNFRGRGGPPQDSMQQYYDDEPVIQKRRINTGRSSRYDPEPEFDDEDAYAPRSRRRPGARDEVDQPYEPRDPRGPRPPVSRRGRNAPTIDLDDDDQQQTPQGYPAHRRGPPRSMRNRRVQEEVDDDDEYDRSPSPPKTKAPTPAQTSFQSRSRAPPNPLGQVPSTQRMERAQPTSASAYEAPKTRKPGAARVVVVTPCFPCTLTRSMPTERIEEYEKLALEHSRNEEKESPIGARLLVTSVPLTTPSGLTQMTEDERRQLIFTWIAVADRIALYTDLGVTPFMSDVIQMATREKRDLDFRLLGDTWARARTHIPTSVTTSAQSQPSASSTQRVTCYGQRAQPTREVAVRESSVRRGDTRMTSVQHVDRAETVENDVEDAVVDFDEEKDVTETMVETKEIKRESPESDGADVDTSDVSVTMKPIQITSSRQPSTSTNRRGRKKAQ